MIRETSILSYYKTLENLEEKQLEVLKAIDEIEPCSDLDVADYLNKPINTITPRRNELVKKGLVVEKYTDISKQTGRRVTFWTRIKK